MEKHKAAKQRTANTGLAKWQFRAPQTHLWLIKVWFSASIFVVKIATFAKPETVSGNATVTDLNSKLRTNNEKIFNTRIDFAFITCSVWTSKKGQLDIQT